jgi:hypothetical protein
MTPLETIAHAIQSGTVTNYDVEHQTVEYAVFLRNVLAKLPCIEDACIMAAEEVASEHGMEFDGDRLIESDPDAALYAEADYRYDDRRER